MTPGTQLHLFPSPETDAFRAEVRRLETWLNEHPAWHTAAAILDSLGRDRTDDQKRHIRGLAQASEWIISGQKGYKHLARATPEEISHFTNWMLSQAGEMTRRAEIIRRHAHKIFG